MTFRYIFALALVACVVVASYFTVSKTVESEQGSVTEINVSGMQRSLTQSAVIYSLRLIGASDSAERELFRKELQEITHRMEVSHKGLVHGNPDMNLPGNPSPQVKAIYFGTLSSLDAQLKDFIREIRTLAQEPDDKLDWNNPHLNNIFTVLTPKLVESLNAVVNQYQKECEDGHARLLKIEAGVSGVTLLVLFLVAMFIFRPMVRRVKRDKHELVRSDTRTRAIIENASDGIITVGRDGSIESFNKAAENIFGYSFDEVKGNNINMLMHEPHHQKFENFMDDYLSGVKTENKAPSFSEVDGKRKNGVTFPMEISLSEARFEDQRTFTVIVRDMTGRKQALERLRNISQAVEQDPGIVMITDIKGNIEYVNKKFCQLTGYTEEEVIGKNPRFLKSGQKKPEEYQSLWNTIASGDEWYGEFYNRKKTGEFYWEHAVISPIRDTKGDIAHYVAKKEDIATLEKHAVQLGQLADHDPLTKLFNRKRFSEELKISLAEARRYGTQCSLVCIDLDDFKRINDTLGHRKGDDILVRFAKLLKARTRETDVLARLGSDEFAVILSHVQVNHSISISEQFIKCLQDVIRSEKEQFQGVTVTASIGIVSYPEHGDDVETLLTYANKAMCMASEEGGNRVRVYTNSQNPRGI